MNKDDIIRMAREADIDWHKHWDDEENRLERFANLVAAHEREACAKLIEEYPYWLGTVAKREIAAAIRGTT